jgi:hypothetical protein
MFFNKKFNWHNQLQTGYFTGSERVNHDSSVMLSCSYQGTRQKYSLLRIANILLNDRNTLTKNQGYQLDKPTTNLLEKAVYFFAMIAPTELKVTEEPRLQQLLPFTISTFVTLKINCYVNKTI